MIITERKHKPLLSHMRIAALWVSLGRCEPISTPSDTGVLHCARVFATYLRIHWHPYRRNKTLRLQRASLEVTDEVKLTPRWSFKASQHNTECRFHPLLHKEGYTESARRSPVLIAYLKTQRTCVGPFDQQFRHTQAIAHSSSDLEWGKRPFWFNADAFTTLPYCFYWYCKTWCSYYTKYPEMHTDDVLRDGPGKRSNPKDHRSYLRLKNCLCIVR